jgi:rhodanese-related sulfurtransferase
VMLAGEPGWVKFKQPTYASPAFVAKGNIVLIDLRPTDLSAASRIARSVSIPYGTLDDRIDDIPKKAPVVLYSDNKDEEIQALLKLRGEGFNKVSLVPGSLDSWLQAKKQTESGPVVTSIEWHRKLGEGEVSPADFALAVSGKTPDAVILDVRTRDEATAGKYANSINIPLDELSKHGAELPKDTKIYIHCTTGARAEMAYKELKKSGFNASFLLANVDCKGTNCTITE